MDFYTPTCTSDKPGGDFLAIGHTFPYRPSQSPVRVTCGAAFFNTETQRHRDTEGYRGR